MDFAKLLIALALITVFTISEKNRFFKWMTSYGRQDETNGHPPTKCPLMEGHTEMSLEFNAVHNNNARETLIGEVLFLEQFDLSFE